MSRNHKARKSARRAAAAPKKVRSVGADAHPTGRLLRCEQLEDRRLMAVITVDTVVDGIDFNDGKTSLREAVFAANTVPGADEIGFDPGLFASGPGTILLTHGELVISDALTVSGPGAGLLTIDASGNDPTPALNNGDGSRAFRIDDGRSSVIVVTLRSMTITGGDVLTPTQEGGGGVLSREDLTIHSCRIAFNAASSNVGGGVYQEAQALTILESIISDNVAQGAGGIWNAGALSIIDSEVSGNAALNSGGGILTGSASILRSQITLNTAGNGGGGIRSSGPIVIQDSTISGNRAGAPGVQSGNGGGILCYGLTTITGTIISGNSAGTGGGIFSGAQSLRIDSSQISSNVAALSGGGLYVYGGVTITSTDVIENSATMQDGGGIYFIGGSLALSHSKLARNSAGFGGGGLGGGSVGGGSSMLLNSCVVTGNSARLEGGGIDANDQLRLIDSVVSFNAASKGGGIYYTGSRVAHIERSTLSENVAFLGGGLAANALVTFVDSTISNNAGGGVYGHFISQLAFRNCTVVENSGLATGVWGNFITLDHTVIANNRNENNAPVNLIGRVTVRYSLVGSALGTKLVEAPLGLPDANGNLIGGPVHGAIDPKLGPLANNGGLVLPGGARLLTHALLAGSPAIDAGDPAVVAGAGGAPEFDQRGAPFTRVAGTRIDMGAVEAQVAGGALDADFDFDGQVDGDDFLVWQRGVGKAGLVTLRNGDATANGVVDGNDLAVWRARFAVGQEVQEEAIQLFAIRQAEEEHGGDAEARDAAFGDASLVGLGGIASYDLARTTVLRCVGASEGAQLVPFLRGSGNESLSDVLSSVVLGEGGVGNPSPSPSLPGRGIGTTALRSVATGDSAQLLPSLLGRGRYALADESLEAVLEAALAAW